MLTDSFGRHIDYLRLAVTDRCNLRCLYCMPACGIDFVARKDLLTYEELERIARVTAKLGVRKIRITGGEPFARKDLLPFIKNLSQIEGIEGIHITTNGALLKPFIPRLKDAGIKSVNLSLDTLDPIRFKHITRKDDFHKVMESFHGLLDVGMKLKINMVVMAGLNEEEVGDMARLSKTYKVDVRYLEEMPFNGTGMKKGTPWNHIDIYNELVKIFPDLTEIDSPPSSTSKRYHIPEFQGNVGIIAAMSRTFCGGCNRIRLTPQGNLRSCLYENGSLSLRDIIRAGADDVSLAEHIQIAVDRKPKDGFEAEKMRKSGEITESMASIGG